MLTIAEEIRGIYRKEIYQRRNKPKIIPRE